MTESQRAPHRFQLSYLLVCLPDAFRTIPVLSYPHIYCVAKRMSLDPLKDEYTTSCPCAVHPPLGSFYTYSDPHNTTTNLRGKKTISRSGLSPLVVLELYDERKKKKKKKNS